jgi:integrase
MHQVVWVSDPVDDALLGGESPSGDLISRRSLGSIRPAQRSRDRARHASRPAPVIIPCCVLGRSDLSVQVSPRSGRPNIRHRARSGLPGFHFRDLRHTGNTLASRTGASLADLMQRMGHTSPRAALIYQHAAQEQDRAIADALSTQIGRERNRARQEAESTDMSEGPDHA